MKKMKKTVETGWACRACGSHDFEKLADGEPTDHLGELPDGRVYTRVEREVVMCTRCEQRAMKISHVMQD